MYKNRENNLVLIMITDSLVFKISNETVSFEISYPITYKILFLSQNNILWLYYLQNDIIKNNMFIIIICL